MLHTPKKPAVFFAADFFNSFVGDGLRWRSLPPKGLGSPSGRAGTANAVTERALSALRAPKISV